MLGIEPKSHVLRAGVLPSDLLGSAGQHNFHLQLTENIAYSNIIYYIEESKKCVIHGRINSILVYVTVIKLVFNSQHNNFIHISSDVHVFYLATCFNTSASSSS
jgi:hypothetical protein